MKRPFDNKRLNVLARKLKEGDAAAAERIFDSFAGKIFAFMMSRVGGRAAAEDLTQDVFVKVISKIETFDELQGNLSAWIWQISRNTLIDYFREKKQFLFSDMTADSEASQPFDLVDATQDPERTVYVAEIMKAVALLSPEEQEVFSLHYVSDLQYKEISRLLDRPEGNLRVIIHRINKKIQKALDG